jgi:hypothetical protein
MKTLRIGVSGHRELLDIDHVKVLIKEKMDHILAQNQYSSMEVYTSLAVGADTAFAEVIEQYQSEIPVHFHFFIPFHLDEYMKDFSKEPEENEIETLKKWLQKGEVSVVNAAKVNTQDQRNEAYYQTGCRICDVSDIVFLVWDGKKEEGHGGTGSVARYLESNKGNKQVVHIRCYRNAVQKTKEHLDDQAQRIKSNYNKFWMRGLKVLFGSALLFATNTALIPHEFVALKTIMTACELSMVVYLIYLSTQIHKARDKENFLNNRIMAERLRVVETLSKCRILEPELEIISNKGIETWNDLLASEKERVKKKTQRFGFDLAYAKTKLMDLCQEQIDYHRRRIAKDDSLRHKNEKLLKIIAVVFVFSVAMQLFIELKHLYHWNFPALISNPALNLTLDSLPLFFCMILPPCYAILEAKAYFKEWSKHIEDSQVMIEFFDKMKSSVQHAADEQRVKILAGRIYIKMCEETGGWRRNLIIKEGPPVV